MQTVYHRRGYEHSTTGTFSVRAVTYHDGGPVGAERLQHAPVCTLGCLGMHVAITVADSVVVSAGPKMSDFRSLLSAELPVEVVDLSKDVEEFAKQFPTVGFEKATMRYTE